MGSTQYTLCDPGEPSCISAPATFASTALEPGEKTLKGGGGENGAAADNRALAAEMVRLRAERARFEATKLPPTIASADTMAKTPQAARECLESVWVSGSSSGAEQTKRRCRRCSKRGPAISTSAPWDWRLSCEKRRKGGAEFFRLREAS